MARPSIKEERREQILTAFEACVARFGIQGATLEKVAEEADLARALIRHNVGNRDDLLEALVDRFLARSRAAKDAMISGLPKRKRMITLIQRLFDASYFDSELMLLTEALIAGAAQDPKLASRMRQWTADFVASIEKTVRDEFPGASKTNAAAVAAGVTGIYFNVVSLSPLGKMPKLLKASKSAAIMLVNSLGADTH